MAATFHTKANAGKYSNALFAYPHIQASPLTLPAGKLILGTSVALGVTDFFQVGANILKLAYQIYNANTKLSIIDTYSFAFALTFGWESYSQEYTSGISADVTSYLPGGVMAFTIAPTLAWFLGGQYRTSSVTFSSGDVTSSALFQGTRVGSDIAWAYAPKRSKSGGNRLGNVLAFGANYDITYKLYGFGMSHHWPGFQLGMHFYPNANDVKYEVIIVGGMSMDI